MRIVAAETRVEAIALSRPYTIAFRTVSAIETVVVVLRDEQGRTGLGAASPEPQVTGETNSDCQRALAAGSLDWLRGRDVRGVTELVRGLSHRMGKTPAARAAVDMALFDLYAKGIGLPLCDVLGRAHSTLPTSITIGIKPAAQTLEEASEYVDRGFRILKVKIGRALDEDIDRLQQLRAHVGTSVLLRVDANQGYTLDQTRRFLSATGPLNLELCEQPVHVRDTLGLTVLEEAERARFAADESLLSAADALRLAQPPWPCGIFNIKLMKCGGIWTALRIATVAELAGIALMWGCMDESCISISAALHAAFASPATRYLDLDGSFDLDHDIANGGFVIEDGCLRTTGEAGLGVHLI